MSDPPPIPNEARGFLEVLTLNSCKIKKGIKPHTAKLPHFRVGAAPLLQARLMVSLLEYHASVRCHPSEPLEDVSRRINLFLKAKPPFGVRIEAREGVEVNEVAIDHQYVRLNFLDNLASDPNCGFVMEGGMEIPQDYGRFFDQWMARITLVRASAAP